MGLFIKDVKRSRFTRFDLHALFYKQQLYKKHQAEIGQKSVQMLSNTLKLYICYLKTIHILHPRYHPEIMGHILKNKRKNKYVCIYEIILLIILIIKMRKEIT